MSTPHPASHKQTQLTVSVELKGSMYFVRPILSWIQLFYLSQGGGDGSQDPNIQDETPRAIEWASDVLIGLLPAQMSPANRADLFGQNLGDILKWEKAINGLARVLDAMRQQVEMAKAELGQATEAEQ
jgi:hypothetical protein